MMQAGFVAALLDPDLPVPAGLVAPDGAPAGRRFDVYRNTVAGGLTRVLEAGFPALRRLVGADFFAAMAGVFLRAHPPRSRILMLYGADFPGFLQHFPPVAHLPYLPDVARLEQALRDSYHAADHRPADLGAIPPEALLGCRLRLAPSARLLRSAWPVRSIRAAALQGGPSPAWRAEDVLVLRAGFDPEPHLLPPGGGAMLAALIGGATLGAAMDAGGEGCDAAAVLGLLLAQGAVAGVECAE
ncbi:HvfC/BufC N-terminal domain-containing protein [Xinfangfangia pollutisoli]|uniref:HvfC/BufC N-terminal domain-containing protein n=1 Tax=Xinfangfangia pollutisoli TaxID=2865960 RepID=UPI001CD7FF60|nr:DNA-binding domain-containing protein [Xinfangfangia pollutisoli]